MASSLDKRFLTAKIEDEPSIEYYDYETENEQIPDLNQASMSSVSVETVDDDDDDDEYTYEIVEVAMEEDNEDSEDDMDSTASPPPLPPYRAATTDPANANTNITPVVSGAGSTPASASVSASLSTTTDPVEALPIERMTVSPVAVARDRNANANANTVGVKVETETLPPPVVLSPSDQRVRAANSAGLSELSKQLRILQAKNDSQAVDIHRLERQLRILADLQGISVSELRRALEDACASEALGELQHRVSKLKHELEAATLAKQAELRRDAAAPHIANLELRVGELEEVEEKQAEEIRNLYETLRQEKAKSTRLESAHQPLKKALGDMIQRCQSETARAAQLEKDFQQQLQDLREIRSRDLCAEAANAAERANSSSGASVSTELAADYEQMVQLLKKKDAELREARAKLQADEAQKAEKLKDAEERARQVQMDMKVERDKLALTVRELEDADGQNGLRLAQYKARFAVQDERIVDMGQQLDSLYTAFTLLNEEFDSEKEHRTAMMSNLKDADAEIARQTKQKDEAEAKEKGKGRKPPPNYGAPPAASLSTNHGTSASTPGKNFFVDEPAPPYVRTAPVVGNPRTIVVGRAPVSPVTPTTTKDYRSLTTTTPATSDYPIMQAPPPSLDNPPPYATARPYRPTPETTPSTWDLLLSNDQDPDGAGNHDSFANYEPDSFANYEPDSAEMDDARRLRESTAAEEQYRHPEDRDHPEHHLISGPLNFQVNGILRTWKTRQCKIYMRGSGYQWDIGHKMSFPIKFGISRVEYHPNHTLSFVVYLDPSSEKAPVIRAAAVKERDYHRWMAALYKATNGEQYEGGKEAPRKASSSPIRRHDGSNRPSPPRQMSPRQMSPRQRPHQQRSRQQMSMSPRQMSPRQKSHQQRSRQQMSMSPRQMSSHSGHSAHRPRTGRPMSNQSQHSSRSTSPMGDQEDADLRRALELSRHVT
eukprot:jgi/Psemu1/322929/estExt_fgenesh1_pg.C_480028